MLPLIDEYVPRRLPILTIALIVICCAIFGYQQSLPTNRQVGSVQAFDCSYGIVPMVTVHGAPAPDAARPPSLTCQGLNAQHPRFLSLLTSIFLHVGWWHLIGNMIFLWVFGANLEDRLGRLRFLPFVLVGGMCAGAVQALSQPSSTDVVIGASGAIAVILGAYLVLFPRNGIWTLVFFVIPMKLPAWLWGCIFVGLQLLDVTQPQSAGAPNIATVAHLSGLAIGALTIQAVAWRRPEVPHVARHLRVPWLSS